MLVLSVGEQEVSQPAGFRLGAARLLIWVRPVKWHMTVRTPDGYKVNANGAWVDANGKEYDAPGGEPEDIRKKIRLEVLDPADNAFQEAVRRRNSLPTVGE